ncbi:hypothetical protein Tco_0111463 [Tanacetum coccineum]
MAEETRRTSTPKRPGTWLCALRNQGGSHTSLEGSEAQDDQETTPSPLTKEQIEGHLSALRSIIKDHNRKNKTEPIRLDFDEEDNAVKDTRIVKGKEVVDDDLRNPFKEALKTPLTRRIIEFAGPEYKMPSNIKLYDGIAYPEDHLGRFASATNLVIIGVPEVMKISSFMDSLKCPELAKRFSDKAPATVDEIMKRLDDFVRSEKAFDQTELPKGETGKQHQKSYFLSGKGQSTSLPYTKRRLSDLGDTRPHFGCSHQTPQGNSGNRNSITLGTPEADDTPPEGWKHGQVLQLPSRERSPHYDCRHLRRQLEAVLEFGKLNHLVKDVRQRGRGNQRGDGPQQAKITNMDVLDEPLIVEAKVEGYLVRRIYIDGGSVEVMFEHCFENLSLAIRARLKETHADLVGFARNITKPLGKIELKVCFGSEGLCRRTTMKFTVIRAPSPYNVILGRTGLRALRAIPSTIYSMMKFPTRGIATLVTRSVIISECRRLENKQVVKKEKREEVETKAVNATEEMLVNPAFPDQLLVIGGRLPEICKAHLKLLLKDNVDIFTWEPADMMGVP